MPFPGESLATPHLGQGGVARPLLPELDAAALTGDLEAQLQEADRLMAEGMQAQEDVA